MSDVTTFTPVAITQQNARYVGNPLVVTSEEYTKENKASAFRENLNFIAEEYDKQKDSFTAKLAEGETEISEDAKNLAIDAKNEFIKKMFEKTGLAIATVDNMDRLSSGKSWFLGTSQRWRETVQYRWDNLLFGFKKGLDALPNDVKDVLGIKSDVAKLEKTDLEALYAIVTPIIAKDSTHPAKSILIEAFERADLDLTKTIDIDDDMVAQLNTAIEGQESDFKGLGAFVNALRESLKAEDATLGSVLTAAFDYLEADTNKDFRATLHEAAQKAIENKTTEAETLAVLKILMPSEEGQDIIDGLKTVFYNTIIEPEAEAAKTPTTAKKAAPKKKATKAKKVEQQEGKRALSDLDESLTVSKWNGKKDSSPMSMLNQTDAKAVFVSQDNNLPSTLTGPIKKAVDYINETVQGNKLTAKNVKHLKDLQKGIADRTLQKGFFKHIEIQYQYDLSAGIDESKAKK